ncbi:MAG TPA: hypothetical protein VIX18_07130 [Nitrospirota bacterium]
MFNLLRGVILSIAMLTLTFPAYAQEDSPKKASAQKVSKKSAAKKATADKSAAQKTISEKPASQNPAAESAATMEQVSKEQIKGLDEQVQEIKTDVLGIAAQLNSLEEKLLFPSNTQAAVFVSMDKGAEFRLDSMEIQLDGKPVTHHLYTFKELEALRKGGVQRIYTGNVTSGEHNLEVFLTGKTAGGSDLGEKESFKFRKDVGPKMVEVHLAGSGAKTITLKDW